MIPPIAILVSSFLGTIAFMPSLLSRLRRRGLVVKDMYKPDRPEIVTHAGLAGLAIGVISLFVSYAIHPFTYDLRSIPSGLEDPSVAAQLSLFAICSYGIMGAIDDRHTLSHLVKGAVPLTLAVPCVALAADRPESIVLLTFLPSLAAHSFLILLITIPVYILVVSNLINMHSGFNGLQSGLSLILLGTLLVRLTIDGKLEDNLVLLVVFGAVAGFYPFNRYPAKAIEGNVGSFFVGAAVGTGIVTNGLFLAGVVMLAPHILDFLLFLYVKTTGKPFIKFGTLRPDGTIQPPYPYKLKFLFPYHFRLTERQTVRWLYGLTAATCALSFLVPL